MILAELKKIKRHYLLPLSIGVVEQCNPYISISDNLFWRVFDESGIRRRYIEKQSYHTSFI